MSFLREVFSEDGQGSASRVMMLLHGLAGMTWVLLFVKSTHQIPDRTTMEGVTAFVSAPYAINKFHAAVASVAEVFKPKLP